MKTRYDIGETVLVQAKVEKINISKTGIGYTLSFAKGNALYASEEEIVISEKELNDLKGAEPCEEIKTYAD